MATQKYNIQFVMKTLMGNSIAQLVSASFAVNKLKKELIKATEEAIKFNEGMANVATLIPQQTERLNDLKESVRALSVESGKSLTDLSEGLYQVISAFGDTADTEEKLDIVTKASIAGRSSTSASLSLLSAITKAYGDTNASALEHVSDLAFKTVELGQTEFPALASSMQGVTSIANNLGVNLDELFTSFATLTGVTGNTAEVSTQLKGAMISLVAPSSELQKLYDEIGVSSGQMLVEAKGFQGALSIINDYSKRTGISLKQLYGRQQAMIGATALGSDQAEVYNEKLLKIIASTGSTSKAFLEQTEGINKAGFAFKKLGSQLSVMRSMIGDALLPGLGGLAEGLNNLIDKAMGLRTANDEVNDTLGSLTSNSALYNDVVEKLTGNSDDLTTSERNLLEIRKQELELDVRQDLLNLAIGYDKVESKIQTYKTTIEDNTKIQEKANAVIKKYKDMGMIEHLTHLTETEMRAKNGNNYLARAYSKLTVAQEDLVSSTTNLEQAKTSLNKLETASQTTKIKTAQMLANEQISVEWLAETYPALYTEIVTMASGMKKQDKATIDANRSLEAMNRRVAEAQIAYHGLSSEELQKGIEKLQSQLGNTKGQDNLKELLALIARLKEQLIVTRSQELTQAESYLATQTKTIDNAIYQQTVGQGLVKIENDRAKATAEATANHVTDATYLGKIKTYYDGQATALLNSTREQAKQNLLLQLANSQLETIELNRKKELADLKLKGITEQGIIDDVNAKYDDMHKDVLQNAVDEWTTKVKGLDIVTKSQEIENDRTKAIAESNKKYGEQADLLAIINSYYDGLQSNLKKTKTIYQNLDDEFRKAFGDEATAYLTKMQKKIGKIQEAWKAVKPLVNAVTDAYQAGFKLSKMLADQEIKLLQRKADKLQEDKDDAIDILNEKNSDELSSLKEMYDSDQLSYEQYEAKKLATQEKFDEDKKLASKKYNDAQNLIKKKQWEADVVAFKNEKKSAIANSIIAGAEGIMNAWSHGVVSGLAGSITIGGATAYQIDKIARQPEPLPPVYLASGGVATSATSAVVGETGPEAIIPLRDFDKTVFGSKSSSSKGDTFIINGDIYGFDEFDEFVDRIDETRSRNKRRNY